jgi:hypothetical protein
MGVIDEAIEILREAEQKLRALIVQAAKLADYDHLPQLAEWAKQLNSILGIQAVPESVPDKLQSQGESLPIQSSNGSHEQHVPRKVTPTVSGTQSARDRRGKNPGKAKSKKSAYPKFLREGDTLVKIGWSRREGKPYEHKAPKTVLQVLIQELIRSGARGERFTTEGLFPLKDPVNKSEIPDYQAYLTLAWVRGNGLILQHGRQGYSLHEDTDLTYECDRLWTELPTR